MTNDRLNNEVKQQEFADRKPFVIDEEAANAQQR